MLALVAAVLSPSGYQKALDVSRSGILVESPVKFTPESSTEFHLKGPDGSIVVPARFIRSEVSAVDSLGVRCQAAAVFTAKVALFPAGQRPTSMAAAPQALAELLVRVTTELNEGASPDTIRTTFEHGLRQLVPACDVRLRHTPAGSLDGCDSIYFTVPTSGSQGTVLQATFDPRVRARPGRVQASACGGVGRCHRRAVPGRQGTRARGEGLKKSGS